MFLIGALAQMWKISEVDFGFKGHLQDKPMQEIQKTMDNGRCKGIHKDIVLEITSY